MRLHQAKRLIALAVASIAELLHAAVQGPVLADVFAKAARREVPQVQGGKALAEEA